MYADECNRLMHLTDARFTVGYVVILHGAAVAWGSKVQVYAAPSTAAAKVQVALSARWLAVWMGHILPALAQPLAGPNAVHMDNQAVLSLLAERRYLRMSKHMEQCFFFSRNIG